jgi:hypothetical protein
LQHLESPKEFEFLTGHIDTAGGGVDLLQTLARVVNRHYAGRWPVLPTPQQ